MSLVTNVLKIRQAFSDPEVPHNPRYSIYFWDLLEETGLGGEELSRALKVMEKEGILRIHGEVPEIPHSSVAVTEEHWELMGVGDKISLTLAELAKSKLTTQEREILGIQ